MRDPSYGSLVPSRDADALAAEMVDWARKDDLVEAGKAARRAAEQLFGARDAARQMADLLLEPLDRR